MACFQLWRPQSSSHTNSQKSLEEDVKCLVGPLVFEDESTISGTSKVISELIDQVCPKIVDKGGRESPVHPTLFSGDNKTEKMLRSTYLALAENGSMQERLEFIEGRHEVFSLYFTSSWLT